MLNAESRIQKGRDRLVLSEELRVQNERQGPFKLRVQSAEGRMKGKDLLTKARRSWNMSRIRAEDTNPELFGRWLLHRMGYR